jgi:hypothetical protein
MAKKATRKKSATKTRAKPKSKAVAKRSSTGGNRKSSTSSAEMGDAFIKLLQSPLVADLVAVAATAALAALAQQGFSRDGSAGKRAGKAVKEAGKAAAKAVGQRLSSEIDEIKKASKPKKA